MIATDLGFQFTEPTSIGLMTHLVRHLIFFRFSGIKLLTSSLIDYEQQRRDLLKKHGIDLDDGNGDGSKTRRLNPREVEKIMGDGPGGVFTWREKNRKKVNSAVLFCKSSLMPTQFIACILCVCLYSYSLRFSADTFALRCGTNSYSEFSPRW